MEVRPSTGSNVRHTPTSNQDAALEREPHATYPTCLRAGPMHYHLRTPRSRRLDKRVLIEAVRAIGWHRALRMRSRVNRGTPQQPGLVFALLPGGACRGVVFRLRRETADAELQRLWAREMPTGVYDPRWLGARTPQGEVQALAFTLSRRSEAHLGRIGDAQMLHILRHASGRYGSTLQYPGDHGARAARARRARPRDRPADGVGRQARPGVSHEAHRIRRVGPQPGPNSSHRCSVCRWATGTRRKQQA